MSSEAGRKEYYCDKKENNDTNSNKSVVDEVKQKIVDKVIDNLQNTQSLWTACFNSLKAFNYVTENPYTGGNQFILSSNMFGKVFADPRWATFKQWKDKGCYVKKGESSTNLIICKTKKFYLDDNFRPEDLLKNEHNGLFKEYFSFSKEKKIEYWLKVKKIEFDKEKQKYYCVFPYYEYFSVFNAEQVNNVEPYIKPEPVITNQNLDLFMDAIIQVSPIKINDNILVMDAPFYTPTIDEIFIPDKSICKSTELRFSTLIHELTHSTGHHSRLNRKFGAKTKWGASKDYAREELVAAFGQIFLCQEFGVKNLEDRHQGYINSWITLLKESKDELFKAASAAEKAVNWLKENVFNKALEYVKNNKSENSNIDIRDNVLEDNNFIDNKSEIIVENKIDTYTNENIIEPKSKTNEQLLENNTKDIINNFEKELIYKRLDVYRDIEKVSALNKLYEVHKENQEYSYEFNSNYQYELGDLEEVSVNQFRILTYSLYEVGKWKDNNLIDDNKINILSDRVNKLLDIEKGYRKDIIENSQFDLFKKFDEINREEILTRINSIEKESNKELTTKISTKDILGKYTPTEDIKKIGNNFNNLDDFLNHYEVDNIEQIN